LPPDDEEGQIGVAPVRDSARCRRLDVHEAAFADLMLLAVDQECRGTAVDEVELVLTVVIVLGAFVAGREDEGVDAECRDAERLTDLAKPVAVTEFVD